MIYRNIIEKYCKENDLIFGICPPNKLDYLNEKDIQAPFVNYSFQNRIDAKATMPNCKSIIFLGVGNRSKINVKKDDEQRGKISIDSVGVDYHKTLKFHLQNICYLIELENNCFEYKLFVDTGPLIEREFAKLAGLGWQGKNMNIMNARFGSFFNIGYILCNISIKEDKPFSRVYSECGECNECITNCPSKCLNEKIELNDFSKCVSFLTQKKGDLTEEEKKLIKNNLYGCDICQLVCKFNNDKYNNQTIEDVDEIYPKIDSIINLTNSQFKSKYENTNFYWIGNKTFKRNAKIIADNLNY